MRYLDIYYLPIVNQRVYFICVLSGAKKVLFFCGSFRFMPARLLDWWWRLGGGLFLVDIYFFRIILCGGSVRGGVLNNGSSES